MRVCITHETVYAYERPVRGIIQLLRMTPRDFDGQHVLTWIIEPDGNGRLKPSEDPFGNLVHTFSAEGPLEKLCIRVTGEVETSETHGMVQGAVERLPDMFYLRESSLTKPDAAIREFASDTVGDPNADPLGAVHRLLTAVHREVAFDTSPTHAATTAAEAFAMRRGVCQDLTHVLIAAARSRGFPARYVSGYLHRADGVTEQEAGHAWAELKVPSLGWVGLDPANGISASEAHVRVAVGLDYLGAAPVRGSRYGGGSEFLDVKLSVRRAQTQMQAQD
ncbi:MAG TPA: transglutaminase family protein [Microvirga sp.]|nr:transglutaminase family protein [Microvirga sp.]